MTKEEKIICKDFLNDADTTHSCNEYKLLMALLEQEPNTINERSAITVIKNGQPLPEDYEVLTKEAYEDLCLRASKEQTDGKA